MTPQEFVVWLRGFMEACNDYTATPKQWDCIKEVLDKVGSNGNTPSRPGAVSTTYSTGNNVVYTTKQQLND